MMIFGGFVLKGLLLTALFYPQESFCLGFLFVMIMAWLLQILRR